MSAVSLVLQNTGETRYCANLKLTHRVSHVCRVAGVHTFQGSPHEKQLA